MGIPSSQKDKLFQIHKYKSEGNIDGFGVHKLGLCRACRIWGQKVKWEVHCIYFSISLYYYTI